MTTINKDNYYDVRDVLSASAIKAFASCEAAALADLRGGYQRPASTALLVGSYIDSALDSDAELEKFLSSHPEIVNSRTGALKADFARASDIVERCKADDLFRALTVDSPSEGHQYIVTGTIGVDGNGNPIPCKGKLDFLLLPDYLERLAARFPAWADFSAPLRRRAGSSSTSNRRPTRMRCGTRMWASACRGSRVGATTDSSQFIGSCTVSGPSTCCPCWWSWQLRSPTRPCWR